MSVAHFDVDTVIDRAFKQKGTVSIDRDTGVVTIRAAHGRRTYTTTLNQIATLIVQRLIMAGHAETKRTRRKKASRGILALSGLT